MATVVCQRVYWPHSWEGLMPSWPMWNLAFFLFFYFLSYWSFVCFFCFACLWALICFWFDLIWFEREREKEYKLGWVGRWEHLGEGEWTLRRVVWKEFEIQFQLRGKNMYGWVCKCLLICTQIHIHRLKYSRCTHMRAHTFAHKICIAAISVSKAVDWK